MIDVFCSLAVPEVAQVKRVFCLALLSLVSWAQATAGQEVEYRALLAPRGQGDLGSSARRSQSQDSPLIYILGNSASLGPATAGQLITIFGPGVGPTPCVGSTVAA